METERRGIGANVQRLRLLRGLSQRRLAEAAGISISFVAHLEGGAHEGVSAAKLAGIARALGVTVDAILVEAGHAPQPIADEASDDTGPVAQPDGEALIADFVAFLRWRRGQNRLTAQVSGRRRAGQNGANAGEVRRDANHKIESLSRRLGWRVLAFSPRQRGTRDYHSPSRSFTPTPTAA